MVFRTLYQPYKWLVVLPLFIISTVCFILAGMVIVFLCGSDAANRITGWRWARFNSSIVPVRVTVRGREHVTPGQSYIVVANHESHFDIFVLWGNLRMDARWVMKKELRRIPLFGLAGKLGGNIYIERGYTKAAYEDLEQARKMLVDGVSLIMFPEGSRSRDGKLGRFRKGAFVLSRNLGIPLLPVSLVGTRSILPPGTLNLLPGHVTVFIHEPVPVEGYSDENLDSLISTVQTAIQRGIDTAVSAAGNGSGKAPEDAVVMKPNRA